MTNRKGGTIDYRSNFPNKKPTGDGDYDINYYGEENFLKSSAFENEKNILQSRICDLEWRNKLLIGSMTVFMILSFATLAFCVILYLNIIVKYQERLSELQSSQDGIRARIEDELHNRLSDEESNRLVMSKSMQTAVETGVVLKGGDWHSFGNVYVNGKPVCDDGWNSTSNQPAVVCRSLGFRTVNIKYT